MRCLKIEKGECWVAKERAGNYHTWIFQPILSMDRAGIKMLLMLQVCQGEIWKRRQSTLAPSKSSHHRETTPKEPTKLEWESTHLNKTCAGSSWCPTKWTLMTSRKAPSSHKSSATQHPWARPWTSKTTWNSSTQTLPPDTRTPRPSPPWDQATLTSSVKWSIHTKSLSNPTISCSNNLPIHRKMS